MITYLSSTEAANRAGLQGTTFRSYISKGLAPEPDAMTGRTPGWLPKTIDHWTKNRIGQGSRTDLKKNSDS